MRFNFLMIRLGPGGVMGMGYDNGLPEIKRLGLSALEIEFTHSVHMTNETASKVGELAKKLDISLSIHAPYFINLASPEKEKVGASMRRILMSVERGHHLGAKCVVYHSGFFQKQDPREVRETITANTQRIMDTIKKNRWTCTIAPELTGKASQFGSVDELMHLRDSTGCDVCIDFAHQKARQQGIIDYAEMFDQLKGLKYIHAHFSGIVWGPKGERHHIITEKSDILPLAEEIVKRKVDMTMINESPDPFGDSVKTLKVFESL